MEKIKIKHDWIVEKVSSIFERAKEIEEIE